MLELKSENNVLFGMVLLFVILGSFLVLGFTGVRTILGFIILIFLPFYLIFDNFSLTQGEKIAFAFFIGIMLSPSLIYWLGFVVSFKLAILIIFMILIIVAYLTRKRKK